MDYSMAQPSCSFAADPVVSPVTKDYIQTVLREHEKNQTLIVKDMSSQLALSFGGNLIAEVFRVKIDGKITKDGQVTEYSKSVIVKKPFRDDNNTPPEIFKYESRFYNNVLNSLETAFKQKLPVIRAIKAEEHIVVTEDFNEGKWELTDHREGLAEVQAKKIVKTLAIFHAASIVVSESDEFPLKKVSKNIQDQVYSESNAELCKKTLADAYAVAKYFADQYLPQANENETAVINKFFSETSDDLYNKAKQATLDTADSTKVYVHGECWANNFMLKGCNPEYVCLNKLLKEVDSADIALLINMATVCRASPARDLVYLFATNPQSVDKKVLVKAYVDELHKYLLEHKKPKNVIEQFSMEFIEDEMERLKPVALLTAIWLLVPISFTSYPTVEEYNRLEREDKPQLIARHIDQEFYVRRLIEILLEYV